MTYWHLMGWLGTLLQHGNLLGKDRIGDGGSCGDKDGSGEGDFFVTTGPINGELLVPWLGKWHVNEREVSPELVEDPIPRRPTSGAGY